MPTNSPPRSRRVEPIRTESPLSAVNVLTWVKASCLLGALLLIVSHWAFFQNWIESVTRLEFAGLKVDRAEADAALTRLSEQSQLRAQGSLEGLTESDRRELLALGTRLSPALNGARLLWVDGSPTNNDLMQRFFEAYGVHVQRESTTLSAFAALESGLVYDVIITSARDGEILQEPGVNGHTVTSLPLHVCPVMLVSETDGKSVAVNDTKVGSFAMIEWLRASSRWTEPIVLYSASYGGRSSGPCMFATNYTGDFARYVLFALAHRRWTRLEAPKPAASASTTADN